MSVKKTIAIIGATGSMGSAIAKSLAKGDYRLLLFANNADKTKALVKQIHKENPETEIEYSTCPMDASWEADIIIPAVPYAAEKELAEKIRQVSTGKIVISISNPLNDTYDGLATPPDTSGAEELQKLLPNSKVVKAFNTAFAADYSQPVINDSKVDLFIAGDDDEAVRVVNELVSVTGFNPMIAGKLAVSRTLENMTLLLIQLNQKYNYNWIGGWKVLHN